MWLRSAQASSSPAQYNTPPSTSVSMMRTPSHRTTHFDFLENHPKIRLLTFWYVLGVVSPKNYNNKAMCSQKDHFYVSTTPIKDFCLQQAYGTMWKLYNHRMFFSVDDFLTQQKLEQSRNWPFCFFRLHWQINSSLTLCHRKYAFTKACFCSKFWAKANSIHLETGTSDTNLNQMSCE